MKILFLDIDGVLNSITNAYAYKQWAFSPGGLDKTKIQILYRIIKETNCKIVISSTWRAHYSIEFFKGLFVGLGWKDDMEGLIMQPPIIGKTQSTGDFPSRGATIKAYLLNKGCGKWNITNYVILDDDSDMLPEQEDHFVKTNVDVGLTYKDAEKVIKILNRGEDENI